METTTQNGPRKEITKGPISVSRVYSSGEFQKKDTLTAELKQQVTTKSAYPSQKATNSKQGNVFSEREDFNFAEKMFDNVETRVAWILVPAGTTVEQVTAKLKGFPNAEIYRELSYAPILTEEQEYAITQGLKTKDEFAKTQVLRYPDTDPANAGKLIVHNGHIQYRRVFFSADKKADVDNRSASNIWASAELAAELSGASIMQGQSIS